MRNLVNGGTTLKPGLPRRDYERTPALFERFAGLGATDQSEVIAILQRMQRGQTFNDAIAEVRGREGGNTTAPKAWANL